MGNLLVGGESGRLPWIVITAGGEFSKVGILIVSHICHLTLRIASFCWRDCQAIKGCCTKPVLHTNLPLIRHRVDHLSPAPILKVAMHCTSDVLRNDRRLLNVVLRRPIHFEPSEVHKRIVWATSRQQSLPKASEFGKFSATIARRSRIGHSKVEKNVQRTATNKPIEVRFRRFLRLSTIHVNTAS